ncbi:MAG: ribonuclease III [Alphaproteobacteria bacterium]|nr:ribonuclease III [Alphaproteobacteria bacterium]
MKQINYAFNDESLLDLALTQSGADSQRNNERLEFIGDRVLGLSVATLLYEMYPNETEGELARRHAMLVSTETLGNVALAIGLDKMLKHGHLTAGRAKHILANAMEAVLGAVYLDGGYENAKDLICDIWKDLAAADATPPKDPKTTLQEFVQQSDKGNLPVYEYLDTMGASHNPTFNVKVSAMGKSAMGKGTSKKEASTNAADALLKILAI